MPNATEQYQCPRCVADPQPEMFASPRNCAFTEDGEFTADNWNCATMSALLSLEGREDVLGTDESMQIIPHPSEDGTHGWLVFARYKQRGCTSNAGYFTQDEYAPLTLDRAELALRVDGETG